MDHMVSRERDPSSIDLESGGRTTSEEEEEQEQEQEHEHEHGSREPGSGVRQAKKLLGRVWSGFVSFDGSLKGEEDGLNSTKNRSIAPPENTELLIDKKKKKKKPEGGKEIASLSANKPDKEKRKSTSAKKPPKPPRPPRGPSLDAADQKLIREISELAMLKRARVERMKAQKKMKAAKAAAASSNSNLCAMLITVVFCLVIIFQGMSSRDSSRLSFQGSPQAAVEMKGPLISVQYYKTPSENGTDGPGSSSPGLVEQVSGSGPNEEGSRVA